MEVYDRGPDGSVSLSFYRRFYNVYRGATTSKNFSDQFFADGAKHLFHIPATGHRIIFMYFQFCPALGAGAETHLIAFFLFFSVMLHPAGWHTFAQQNYLYVFSFLKIKAVFFIYSLALCVVLFIVIPT